MTTLTTGGPCCRGLDIFQLGTDIRIQYTDIMIDPQAACMSDFSGSESRSIMYTFIYRNLHSHGYEDQIKSNQIY